MRKRLKTYGGHSLEELKTMATADYSGVDSNWVEPWYNYVIRDLIKEIESANNVD